MAMEPALAGLAPGAEVEVSQVVGRGFCSLLNSYEGLPAAMEVRGGAGCGSGRDVKQGAALHASGLLEGASRQGC
jgi:hypothetical protein